jgi:hypothetical protein
MSIMKTKNRRQDTHKQHAGFRAHTEKRNTTHTADTKYSYLPQKTYGCINYSSAPDDGRCDGRNMLSEQ